MYAAMEDGNEITVDYHYHHSNESDRSKEENGIDTMTKESQPQEATWSDILSSDAGDESGNSGDEFEPEEAEGIDDETTLDAEERLGREISYEEEMNILQREREIPIEKLREMYASMSEELTYKGTRDESGVASSSHSHAMAHSPNSLEQLLFGSSDDKASDDGEYLPQTNDIIDDETTLVAEEQLGREMSYEEEIALLNRENEIPVEALRKMYAEMNEGSSDGTSEVESKEVASEEMGIDNEENRTSIVDDSELPAKRKAASAGVAGTTKRRRCGIALDESNDEEE